MFGTITYENENVFINGQEIIGVNSIDLSIEKTFEPISILGEGLLHQEVNSQTQKTIQFSKILSSNDYDIINLLGQKFNFSYFYKTRGELSQQKKFSATEAIIDSINMNCVVGEVPSSTYSLGVLNKSEYISGQNSSVSDYDGFTVVNPNDLEMNFYNNNVLETNRIRSFELNVNIPFIKNSFIGSSFIEKEELTSPLEITLNFQLDVDDLSYGDSSDFLCESDFNAEFLFKKCSTQNEIFKFRASGAQLRSSDFSSSIDGYASASFLYVYYVNNFEELKEIFFI